MKKFLKIASVICALLLSISVFVGCGEKYNLGGYENLDVFKGNYQDKKIYKTSGEIADVLEARDILIYGLTDDIGIAPANCGYRAYLDDNKTKIVIVFTQTIAQLNGEDWQNKDVSNINWLKETLNGRSYIVADNKLLVCQKSSGNITTKTENGKMKISYSDNDAIITSVVAAFNNGGG